MCTQLHGLLFMLRTKTIGSDSWSSCMKILETRQSMGLIPTLREVMPGAHHRFCAWHLVLEHDCPGIQWAKVDDVCNNMCEVINTTTKLYKCNPILTLLEEVRRYVMTGMAKNKLKLFSHVGHLPPIQQSRLAKEWYHSRYHTPM
ncbi:hypothetical protein Ahy_B04g073573 [Arachis hypogaea]|uniref:Uncharacterized protein n=1 Tax=Arachis hypogaea TaxID=3818 RepID=A0A444ZQP4_ARAHY|nr:hypothetical protein Ahy_B04g073573 [Arachis hypogaea]